MSAAMALVLGACGGEQPRAGPGDTTCDGRIDGTTYITVWFHAGPSAEWDTLASQAAAFNASQETVRVQLITLPEGPDYADLVESAAASGDLPDLLDFDGPNLYNYAWSGKLKPIGSCVPEGLAADLLPSIRQQGTYAGKLWGLGTFDSGLGLYVRPSVLTKAGIRIPNGPDDAWTAEELTGILDVLRKAGYQRPLDLRINFSQAGEEWNTYGFAPAVWSAGGDLIDRTTYRTVEGYLNGPPAVKALTTLQSWANGGYIDPDEDEAAFTAGRSPVSWVGHWVYDEFNAAFPGDVKIVPLPDFGQGTATGSGSFQWGVTANATDGDAVWRFLAYLMSTAEVHRMTQANGAIPATLSAIRLSPRYAAGGPEEIFSQQLQSGVAMARPQTPAYPAISEAFSTAYAEIMAGAAVKPTLDAAVRSVEQDLRDHQYYPTTGS